jgi:putative membrane protein
MRQRATALLLSAGALIFIAVLASQGLPAVLSTLSLAGWGILAVALFHLLPLLLDALAIRVLFDATSSRGSFLDAFLARWAGESANCLMPVGQIGGPVLMARHLAQRGMSLAQAGAAITVSITLQAIALFVFVLLGMAMLFTHTSAASQHALRTSVLIASIVLLLPLGPFYLVQRRGLFGRLVRLANRFAGNRDWSALVSRAAEIDAAVERAYGSGARTAASFALNLLGWVAGTGEVYLIVLLLGVPLGWADSLLLESLGQAIRGAAFAIPAALGVQEGGYLLLGPLVGLPPDAALALSLAKRAREILLGVPGLIYLHRAERRWHRGPIHEATDE